MRYTYRIEKSIAVGSVRRRRPRGAIPIVAVIAVLSTAGAIGAEIAHRNNAARASRYAQDPSCRASLVTTGNTISSRASCTGEDATVTAQYIHSYRSSHYYRLGLRTADGMIDSVEMTGPAAVALWRALPVGSVATVQRFAHDAASTRHVTLVRVGALEGRTEWNPAWQEGNTLLGVWFLGLIAMASCITLWIHARRSDANTTSE